MHSGKYTIRKWTNIAIGIILKEKNFRMDIMTEIKLLPLLRNMAWLMAAVFAGLTGFLAFRHGPVVAVFAASTLALAWVSAALLADNIRLRRR